MDKLQKLLEVKRLLNSISDKMNGLKLDIDTISGCVENSQFISKEVSGRVIGCLGEINLLNEECRNLYAQIALTNELSSSIAEVEKLVSEAITVEEREGVLSKYKRFYLLMSDDGITMELLDTRKKELKSILEEPIEDNIDKLEAYNTFVDAVLEDDSTKAFSYAMSLAPFFGNDLLAKAFMDKKVYMAEAIVEEVEAIDCITKVDVIEELTATQDSIDVTNVDDAEVEETPLIIKDELIDAGLILTKEYINKEYYNFDSPAEGKEVGAKTFLKDVKSRRSVVDVELVRTIGLYGVATSKLVASGKHISTMSVDSSLSFLRDKGYVRTYGINGMGAFGVFSPKGQKCISSSEVRSRLGIKGKGYKDNYVKINNIYSVLTKIAYTRMMECYIDAIDNISRLHAGIIMTECCANYFRDASNDNRYVFAGMFCNKADELDEFISKLKNMLGDEYCHIMIAGMDKVIAKNNAKYIIDKLELDESKVYYHSLDDNTYYSYLDDENIKFPSLFGIDEDIREENIIENSVAAQTEEIEETVENQFEDKEKQDESVGYEEKVEQCEIVTQEETHEEETAEVAEDIDLEVANDSEPEAKPTVDMQEVMNNAYQMIIDDKTYCATTYLRSYMGKEKEEESVYGKLAYAVNDPWMRCSYNSDKIFDLYLGNDDDVYCKYLMVSATIRNFFYNHIKFDYSLKSLHQTITKCFIVSDNNGLTKALYRIFKFKDENNKGADFYASYRTKDKEAIRKEIELIKNEAQSYYESYVKGMPKNHKHVTRFIDTWKLVFSDKGDLATCLNAVVNNDTEMLELAREFIADTFIGDNCSVEFSNIDRKKINKFIDDNWDKANTDGSHYKSTPLMSDLRNNITNAIEKVIRVICRWIDRVEASGESQNDTGAEKYAGMKNDLLENLEESLQNIEASFETFNLEEKAGAKILMATIKELIHRIDGSYNEKKHLYYYVDFLRGKDVLLDDDYMPDMRGSFVDFIELSISNRILRHSKEQLMSFEEKLDYIFKNYGDDYGTAKLIIKYLEDLEGYICPDNYNIKESVEHARRDAEKKQKCFIENLELAQSYGQIEETKENKKDKIHKITNDWYEYAVETHNYGFFNNVLTQYNEKIQEDAKVRGKALTAELENIKRMGDIPEDKKNKIEELIKEQNYTLAEDYIARIDSDESEEEIEILSRDYLKDFLRNYDDYHNKVADCGYTFRELANRKIRNKDDKGGRKLADNWINSGQQLREDRMAILLSTLGFKEPQVKRMPKLNNKLDNCIVTFKGGANNRTSYEHPIPAFGSIAMEKGFRVVCLYGRYEVASLIAELKDIPTNKPTLVLLDYAMSLPDKKTFARKAKEILYDKVIGLIDRTLLMFLVENYNEPLISQIMMSTMMPFSYYQPYVYDSDVFIPPEIFIGRGAELDQIVSPSGANIVYGGRQLGKTALLKRAKMRVDNNDNHDRAVYVSIKDMDYKEAAKKIGDELALDGVLESDVNVDDWNGLARIIKKRLMDKSQPEIPYLLLLIDEADTFIESCEDVKYQPFDALKDIQTIGIDRFKFVIAGLHNIVRFKRDAALSNNSVLTKLSHVTITPFKKLEARQLLEMPLYYLGLRFPEDKDSQVMVSTILANTNYFPGLIQLYCAKLIEAMTKDDYAGYNEKEAPAYKVNPNHVKKILVDKTFREQVRDKFEITLKLDEDNMYYIIALLMTYLYHMNSNAAAEIEGYSAMDIIDIAKELSVKKVKDQKKDIINGFMEELQELNILRKTVNGGYLFSRYSFFQMMGTLDEVEEKMFEYMED